MKNYFKYLLCTIKLSAFVACDNSSHKEGGNNKQDTKTTSQTGGTDLFLSYEIQAFFNEGFATFWNCQPLYLR